MYIVWKIKEVKCNKKRGEITYRILRNISVLILRERKRPKICWYLRLDWPGLNSFSLGRFIIYIKNHVISGNNLWEIQNAKRKDWKRFKKKQKPRLRRITGAEHIFLVSSSIRNSEEDLKLYIVGQHHFSQENLIVFLLPKHLLECTILRNARPTIANGQTMWSPLECFLAETFFGKICLLDCCLQNA